MWEIAKLCFAQALGAKTNAPFVFSIKFQPSDVTLMHFHIFDNENKIFATCRLIEKVGSVKKFNILFLICLIRSTDVLNVFATKETTQ